MHFRLSSIVGRTLGAVVASLLLPLILPLTVMSFAQSSAPDAATPPDGFDLQGHRGARGLAPENTIPAFRRALELGVTTLEMDVVIAGDGTVVVSHEPWMNRVICRTPDGGRIGRGQGRQHNLYQMSYQEVAAYDCGSLQHPDFPEQRPQPASKPRLRDVVTFAERYTEDHDRPPVFYNIEIKSRPAWDGQFHPPPEQFAERVLAVADEEEVEDRTTIQSFDPRALEAVRHAGAAVRTALLISRMEDEGVAANLDALSFVPDIYSPDHRLVDANLVDKVHERGMILVPWTVNDPAAMRRLVELGVDGLITDYPDRGRALLQAADPSGRS